MKAIVQVRYGSPDGLEFREVEKPAIGDDQVLVKVRAASVNALDWGLMKRFPHVISRILRMPRGRVPGVDLSGVVEAVGKNVTRLAAGDEVFGSGIGAFAEYAVSTERRLTLKPATVAFEQAAALPVAGLTALQGLRDKACLQAGRRVVVYGAGGGVGTFAVQIAKALGGHVTAVSSTQNMDLLRGIGADEVIDYTKEDFTRRGQRYDVLFDIGANRSFADCRRTLVENGNHVMAAGGKHLSTIVSRMLRAQFLAGVRRQRVGMFMARVGPEDLAFLGALVAAGKISPVIDRRYPLSGVPDAIRHVGTGAARGKVVIDIG